MNEMDVSRVLAQIRALKTQATMSPAAPKAAVAAGGTPKVGFENVLKQAVDQVSRAQSESSRLQDAFARGDRSVELSQVMLAGANAQVQFRAAVEVRNRLVSAYQDIMNMPV
ncbi:MAG TPA: flagellar hook-basal body complex protein FliE [Solimonas sp.]|nr:flagellar hook-basal body complex protein FliE [Solimonas sp.]